MNWSRLTGAGLGAMVLLMAPRDVAAADPAAEQAAKERFAQGRAFFEKGDYEAARAALLQAYALAPLGFIARNIASAEMHLDKRVDALHHLQAALAAPDLSPNRRAVVQKELDEAFATTGHISLSAPE